MKDFFSNLKWIFKRKAQNFDNNYFIEIKESSRKKDEYKFSFNIRNENEVICRSDYYKTYEKCAAAAEELRKAMFEGTITIYG